MIYLFGEQSVCQGTRERLEDNVLLSFHHVVSKDQTHIFFVV